MEIDAILKLMNAVAENSLTEFSLEEGNFKLHVKRKRPLITANTEEIMAEPCVTPVVRKTEDTTLKTITSPLIGTFYASPSPDEEPFAKVGDHVKKGQILGIVEAMKLMNEIESEYDGVIEEVMVKNEEVVDYGRPLFQIRPEGEA